MLQTGTADAVKLVVFVSMLGAVGWLSYRGKLPRTRPIVPGELATSATDVWSHQRTRTR